MYSANLSGARKIQAEAAFVCREFARYCSTRWNSFTNKSEKGARLVLLPKVGERQRRMALQNIFAFFASGGLWQGLGR
jgi:hypothetical protein